MSIFSRLDRIASGTCDTTCAVRFEVHPAKASPNGRPGPDPQREIWDGRGIFDENPTDAPVEIGNRDRAGNDLRTPVNGSRYELSVDRSRFRQTDTTKQGDRIWLDDLRKFEILSVQPDGLSRVVFQLAELRATAP
ncbi:hypothetical protein [Agrobacterium rosae]|uniref:hypothetical protein n=1 Tax=Agrobacterium rosae TaxID=1972867 RepID=UPI0020333C22|nr:hypothetical protein [Agrobacterium rosae]MCM2435363.1 hypothetical protein [Agrobacterium rosae]